MAKLFDFKAEEQVGFRAGLILKLYQVLCKLRNKIIIRYVQNPIISCEQRKVVIQ